MSPHRLSLPFRFALACGVRFALAFGVLAALVTLPACQVESDADDPAAADSSAAPHVMAASDVEAGRYLVIVGGCNDCHTPGFMENGFGVPEAQHLTGLPVGFRGPWGTSYPRNLRLTVQQWDEDTWVQTLHTRTTLPPMPWPNVNRMSERDARAIYRYIRSLGPAGQPAPEPVPPGQEPTTPYFDFVPQHLERLGGPPPAAPPAAPPAPADTARADSAATPR